jgi:hypothetical protein
VSARDRVGGCHLLVMPWQCSFLSATDRAAYRSPPVTAAGRR